MSAAEIGTTVAALMEGVAAAMEVRAQAVSGLSALREVADLEPEMMKALEHAFPERAAKNIKCAVPNWPNVGNVDIVVRHSPESAALRLAGELKWCYQGQLDETPWDLFKMALISRREDVDSAYLIVGASAAVWATHPCRDQLETASHDPREICRLRYPTGKKGLIWDWALEGGYDRFPTAVPADITTTQLACVTVRAHTETWQLRAVRVTSTGDAMVPFPNGWPDGERPDDAKHPLLKPPV